MMMAKDEWIRAAMTEDSMVAELLIRFKQSHASLPAKISPVNLPRLRWGHRQPRSRSVLRCDAVSSRKDGEPTRCSPTTPLSWSGGTGSPTTTADGFEASSRLNNCSPSARSKGIVTNEAASIISRKSRKKKTFSDLKEEENILLKESLYLNKELATLRATFKEQTTRNECLKRLKVEYSLHFPRKTTAASIENNQSQQMQASTFNEAPLLLPTHVPSDKVPQPDSIKEQKSDATQERYFMLPDLNTTPSENDSCFETLYGMS